MHAPKRICTYALPKKTACKKIELSKAVKKKGEVCMIIYGSRLISLTYVLIG